MYKLHFAISDNSSLEHGGIKSRTGSLCVIPGHVLSPIALLREALPTLVTAEGFDVEMNHLVVAVKLGLAALPVEHPLTYVTLPLERARRGRVGCRWEMGSSCKGRGYSIYRLDTCKL